MNVSLVGFRCTGKTSVGQFLARHLAWEFVDSDKVIEEETGISIADIFALRGEESFRLIESDVIRRLAKRDRVVLATGGGAVLRFKNVEHLRRGGIVLLLEADEQTLLRRIFADPRTRAGRPPLSEKDPRTEISEQLALRRACYLKAAEFAVYTNSRSVEQVVEEILPFLRARGIRECHQEPPWPGGPTSGGIG